MKKVLRNSQAGFTLMEMLITVLILGILAAAGGAVYLGYAKDAKTAEGKAIIGSMWTALQACAQTNPGSACAVADQYGRVGLTGGGVSADGRWTVAGGGAGLTMDKTTGKLSLASAITATGTAAATDITGIVVSMTYTDGNTPPGALTCKIPPAAAASAC